MSVVTTYRRARRVFAWARRTGIGIDGAHRRYLAALDGLRPTKGGRAC